MSLHSPSRLKPEEKEEGEKDAGEILWCVFGLSLSPSFSFHLSLSLARHLTSPGKRQIRFRLLSRQSKLRKTFFSFLLFLSAFFSPSRCLCFISVDAVLWRPLTRFSNNNSSPPPPPQVSSLPEPYTCQHILYRALNQQQTLSIFTAERDEGPIREPLCN